MIQKKEFVKMRGPEKPGESGRPKRTPFSLRAYARIHAVGNRMFAKPAVFRRLPSWPDLARSLVGAGNRGIAVRPVDGCGGEQFAWCDRGGRRSTDSRRDLVNPTEAGRVA